MKISIKDISSITRQTKALILLFSLFLTCSVTAPVAAAENDLHPIIDGCLVWRLGTQREYTLIVKGVGVFKGSVNSSKLTLHQGSQLSLPANNHSGHFRFEGAFGNWTCVQKDNTRQVISTELKSLYAEHLANVESRLERATQELEISIANSYSVQLDIVEDKIADIERLLLGLTPGTKEAVEAQLESLRTELNALKSQVSERLDTLDQN